MRQQLLPGSIALCLLSSCILNNNNDNVKTKETYPWPKGIAAPVAEIKPHLRSIHGDTVPDNYYWMIDYFKKGADSNRVVDYLKAENTYLDTMMGASKKFQQQLFAEMKGRIKEKDESVPVFKNGYFYYTRNEEGKQYYKYCRKKGSLEAKEEILLDADAMAEGHPYFAATGFSISEDNTLMAYGIDTVSRRQYIIHIKNLETGETMKDAIYHSTGNAVWGNDNKTLFYTENNQQTLLTEKIKRHTLGTDAAADAVVYHEKDNSNYIGVGKSKSGKYIYIVSQATMSSEYRMLDASAPNGDFKVFQPRMKDVLYEVTDEGDRFLVVTNRNAKNFRLMECAYDETGSEHWKEVIPNRADVLLEGIDEFNNFLVIIERKNGLRQLQIRNRSNKQFHYLDFGEPAYTANPAANPEFTTATLRYTYTSLTTPVSVFDYHMETKVKKLMKQQEVVGGYDSKLYTTERIYAVAKDGSKVPISIVYKNGLVKDGHAPLLLYAYGSYGNSIDASFSSARLSLLNRGFVFAIAHIRGGQEMGRQWYEDGKLMKKKNTFTDFIDCGEYLITEKYTSKQHLYAQGGSAGGLLMGAVATMRPDLWNGVVAQVPFVDVINTMLDESIPLTTNEFDEWGNPKNKEAYDYMKSYSPYEHVSSNAYPNMLVTTGLHDSQVQYFEPAKWVAKIRALKTDDKLLLLYINMEAGHGGASGRFNYLKEVAMQYAFLFALENITE
jgi:oligopeptidase B